MLKTPRFYHVQRLVALVTLVSLVGCSNCTAPSVNLGAPASPTLTCAQNANIGIGVPLGTAATFAVLGGSTVTNTNTPTIVTGDLGVSPGSAVTGFPPGLVIGGSIHAADATAAQAQSDLTTAYNNAALRVFPAPTSVSGDIGGMTLAPGTYKSTSTLGITGTVTLDGKNNPNSVFIFQIASGLFTASASSVLLINSAKSCNVFWQVGSQATLGTGTSFAGNILALTAIVANTGASVTGRLLARNGAVTLDDNNVTKPGP